MSSSLLEYDSECGDGAMTLGGTVPTHLGVHFFFSFLSQPHVLLNVMPGGY